MDMTFIILAGLGLLVGAFLVMIAVQAIKVEKTVETLVDLTESQVSEFYSEGGA